MMYEMGMADGGRRRLIGSISHIGILKSLLMISGDLSSGIETKCQKDFPLGVVHIYRVRLCEAGHWYYERLVEFLLLVIAPSPQPSARAVR